MVTGFEMDQLNATKALAQAINRLAEETRKQNELELSEHMIEYHTADGAEYKCQMHPSHPVYIEEENDG